LRVDSEPPSATRVERTVLTSQNRRSPEQSSTHRTKPQPRGRRPLLLAAGLGLLLLGLGGGGLWMVRRRPVLELDSDPPRVSVLLDGADVGHTPMRVALERGSHELVLAADGFKPLRHSLPPFSGTQPLKLTLTKRPGKLSIVTVPEGAIVTLDGQVQQNHSPTTITDVSADQPHDVVLTFEGYEEVHVRGLVVPAGQLVKIEKALIQRAPDPIEPPK
jgi:hypothetical protein